MTTWNEFIQYLSNNILESESSNSLKSSTVSKYQIPTDLVEEVGLELEALSDSNDNKLDSEYHNLPKINKEIEEEINSFDDERSDESYPIIKKVLKTWTELFPSCENCLFGESDNTCCSEEVYLILQKIYEDWWKSEEKVQQLTEKKKELEDKTEEFTEEWVNKQIYHVFQKKGINILPEMKNWITDYETLSKEQQGQLENEYEIMKRNLKHMEEEEAQTVSSKKQSWFKSLDWKTIVVSSGIGFIIILVLIIVRKYVK